MPPLTTLLHGMPCAGALDEDDEDDEDYLGEDEDDEALVSVSTNSHIQASCPACPSCTCHLMQPATVLLHERSTIRPC